MSGGARGSSPRSTLEPLQRELLEGFFRREQGFFLTGGGALAGFHLGHRKTRDRCGDRGIVNVYEYVYEYDPAPGRAASFAR